MEAFDNQGNPVENVNQITVELKDRRPSIHRATHFDIVDGDLKIWNLNELVAAFARGEWESVAKSPTG